MTFTIVTLFITLFILTNIRVESLRLPNSALLKHRYEINHDHNSIAHSKSVFVLKSSSFDLTQDFASTALCTGLSTGLIYVLTKLAKDEIIDTKLCRKLIHTLAAPAFVVLWPLYSSSAIESRLMASSLAFIQLVRLILAGMKKQNNISNTTSVRVEIGNLASTKSADSSSMELLPKQPKQNNNKDKGNDYNLADAISRSGNRSEALGGPVIYTAVLLISILFFFRLVNCIHGHRL
jgi:hypothetical protein